MERPAQLFSHELVSAVIKAYDVRGLVGEQIDADFVRAVGASFARLMRGEGQTAIVVGHDMRESSRNSPRRSPTVRWIRGSTSP